MPTHKHRNKYSLKETPYQYLKVLQLVSRENSFNIPESTTPFFWQVYMNMYL